jgi:hypothetical protein
MAARNRRPHHWRQTWLLTAGLCFTSKERRHLRAELIDLLAEIDTESPLHAIVAPGADLALDLLEDDVAIQPALQRRLFKHALELLRYPPDQDLIRRASVLIRMAERDEPMTFMLKHAIDQALLGTPTQVNAARQVLQATTTHDFTTLPDELRPQYFRAQRIEHERAGEPNLSLEDLIRAEIRTDTALTDSDQRHLAAFVDHLDGNPHEFIDRCLVRPPIANALAKVTIAAALRSPTEASVLRNMLRAWIQRRVVGDELARLTFDDPADD